MPHNQTATSITLDYPITTGDGRTLNELSVRRAKVADLRALSHVESEDEKGAHLMARLTGLVIEDFDLLDLADFAKLQTTFQESSGFGATTGLGATTQPNG